MRQPLAVGDETDAAETGQQRAHALGDPLHDLRVVAGDQEQAIARIAGQFVRAPSAAVALDAPSLLPGMPDEIVWRHPFPGPGLGVRILGEVKPAYAEKLKLADDIFIEELHKQKLYDATSQAFAVFLPVKSVGVMGDGRRYEYVIALRAVETIDFMTARWARLPYEFLEHVSLRIINEVDGISRVTYDISGKPPATIEWE